MTIPTLARQPREEGGNRLPEGTLHAIASMIRAALSSVRQRDRLADEARRDALTGLYNRRYLDERLPAEIDRASRHDRSLGLVMVDVDDFKRFNRDYGHSIGDTVLTAVADTLRRSLRTSDISVAAEATSWSSSFPKPTRWPLDAEPEAWFVP